MDKKVVSEITISDTIKLVDLGTDIAEEIITFSKVNAASQLFGQNIDLLREIKDTADYAKVSSAAQTVINAMSKGLTEYYQELSKAIVRVSSKALAEELADTVLKENPVYKGYKLAMSILKITGGSETPKCVYAILCYSDMINAADRLSLASINKVDSCSGSYYFYEAKKDDPSDTIRYLTHSAQLSMLAEQVYIDLPNSDKTHDALAMQNIKSVIKWSDKINLPLAKALKEQYS